MPSPAVLSRSWIWRCASRPISWIFQLRSSMILSSSRYRSISLCSASAMSSVSRCLTSVRSTLNCWRTTERSSRRSPGGMRACSVLAMGDPFEVERRLSVHNGSQRVVAADGVDVDDGAGHGQRLDVFVGICLAVAALDDLSVVAVHPGGLQSVQCGPEQFVQIGAAVRPCLARLRRAGWLRQREGDVQGDGAGEGEPIRASGCACLLGCGLDVGPPWLDLLRLLDHNGAAGGAVDDGPLAALSGGAAVDAEEQPRTVEFVVAGHSSSSTTMISSSRS